MLVWCSLAAASASRRKRGTALGLSPMLPLKTLRATLRLSDNWRASKTTPMPPRPTSRTISKSPSRFAVGGWLSGDDIKLSYAGFLAFCKWANDLAHLPGGRGELHVAKSLHARRVRWSCWFGGSCDPQLRTQVRCCQLGGERHHEPEPDAKRHPGREQ